MQGYAELIGRDGEAVDKGVSSTGVTFVGGRERGPMLLVDDGGTAAGAPCGADELAVDVDTAVRPVFHVGDTVDVLSAGPRRTFDLVGLFRLGDADTGPFAFLAFDLPTSQDIAAAAGRLDAVYVRSDPGVPVAELRRSLRAGLGPAYEVMDPEQIVQSDNQDVGEFVNLLTGLLLGFAALGVVVGAFIIFNTFTILVTQRTHELGLLRAMGASRRQVITSVVVEAGVVGALASAAGVLLGIVVARLLMSLVDSLGFRIPSGDAVVAPRTVGLAVAVGLLVTVGRRALARDPGVAHPAGGRDRRSPRSPSRDVPPAHARRVAAARRGHPGAAGRHLPCATGRGRPGRAAVGRAWARSCSSSASWCCSRCSRARWRAGSASPYVPPRASPARSPAGTRCATRAAPRRPPARS